MQTSKPYLPLHSVPMSSAGFRQSKSYVIRPARSLRRAQAKLLKQGKKSFL